MQSTVDSKIRANGSRIAQAARRGVSLVEVLVVLVILVVGILVIIRLYPSGFFSVQSVGNAAVADSLGNAALQAAQENLGSLPEAIQPGGTNASFPGGMDSYGRPQATAADASYDPEFNSSVQPDYSKTLDRARLVVNETTTVPTASSTTRQSVYVTRFGPIVMNPATAAGGTPIPTPEYLSINSTYWLPVTGDSTVPTSVTAPQDSAPVGSQQFVVDMLHQRIAVPYAAYTAPNFTPGISYDQKMVVYILGSNGVTYPQYLNIPKATPRDSSNPYAPYSNTGNAIAREYLPDTTTNYQGGWFDPTLAYSDTGAAPHTTVPTGVTWVSVSLFRPFVGTATFTQDPYEFKLTSPNLGTSNNNLGGIAFNPLAGGGVGYNALKARISYRVASWQVIHEDRDVPALSGGNTSVLRLALKNLKRAGDEGPNNTIDPGLLSSGHSMYIMDLDTGQQVAPGTAAADPTNPDLPIVDEDVQGTSTDPKSINISFAIGRLTFGSNAFGDNPNANGVSVVKSHRVRVFYTGDLNWTIAVQKAPAYYVVDNFTQAAFPAAGILPGHCYYDANASLLMFPQSDAGKTVAVDGSSNQPGQTVAIGNAVTTVNSINYVSLPYTANGQPITAVRGLSARAVVAWQERGLWKSHSVDTILNRTP